MKLNYDQSDNQVDNNTEQSDNDSGNESVQTIDSEIFDNDSILSNNDLHIDIDDNELVDELINDLIDDNNDLVDVYNFFNIIVFILFFIIMLCLIINFIIKHDPQQLV